MYSTERYTAKSTPAGQLFGEETQLGGPWMFTTTLALAAQSGQSEARYSHYHSRKTFFRVSPDCAQISYQASREDGADKSERDARGRKESFPPFGNLWHFSSSKVQGKRKGKYKREPPTASRYFRSVNSFLALFTKFRENVALYLCALIIFLISFWFVFVQYYILCLGYVAFRACHVSRLTFTSCRVNFSSGKTKILFHKSFHSRVSS